MKIDISTLLSIKNFAKKEDVSTSYIYKLIRAGKMKTIIIDEINFIDTKVHSTIPVLNRRK